MVLVNSADRGPRVVRRNSGASMLRVVDPVHDQPLHVIVLQFVKDLISFPPGSDQPRHPQFRQMLRDRRPRLSDGLGELVDRSLAVDQGPEDLDASAT